MCRTDVFDSAKTEVEASNRPIHRLFVLFGRESPPSTEKGKKKCAVARGALAEFRPGAVQSRTPGRATGSTGRYLVRDKVRRTADQGEVLCGRGPEISGASVWATGWIKGRRAVASRTQRFTRLGRGPLVPDYGTVKARNADC
ncbi:hypothetical protein HPB50_009765 [Hyalomma asiaticum]|uniref:Uncharacterized protein n=1 Tax=Hyalomma asiaticum TaxID=266040 RepID=A0ACB7S1T2_HYAAI|nr:hypothetical protein HPB50_009765 [Hyalomma asiaticum]